MKYRYTIEIDESRIPCTLSDPVRAHPDTAVDLLDAMRKIDFSFQTRNNLSHRGITITAVEVIK